MGALEQLSLSGTGWLGGGGGGDGGSQGSGEEASGGGGALCVLGRHTRLRSLHLALYGPGGAGGAAAGRRGGGGVGGEGGVPGRVVAGGEAGAAAVVGSVAGRSFELPPSLGAWGAMQRRRWGGVAALLPHPGGGVTALLGACGVHAQEERCTLVCCSF